MLRCLPGSPLGCHDWYPIRPSCTALIAEGGAVPVAQFDDPPPAGGDQQARRTAG